jgi:hypothetical protein
MRKNEFVAALEARKAEILAAIEADREVLRERPLFDLRSVYLAELEKNKLPYTELDTKDKFIDLLVFMTRRKLETICISAAAARISSASELDACRKRLDEVAGEWAAKLPRTE